MPLPPVICKSKSGRLSAADAPPPEKTTGTQHQPENTKRISPLAGKRIVVCEDEGITLLQLRRALSQAGLIVAGTAPNGKIGVETVLRERPDLVLMDIRMPVMNGIDATQEIIRNYPVCVVMLTAFSTEDFQAQAQEAGASGYIIKPVTSALLLPQLEAAYSNYKP